MSKLEECNLVLYNILGQLSVWRTGTVRFGTLSKDENHTC